MSIKYHDEVLQGTDEWLALRCGIITASELKLLLTPTLKKANNDKVRTQIYALASQRITGRVPATYQSFDMMRGQEDEVYAKMEYNKHFAETKDTGFITNDDLGFTIGCSPDALVGDDGGLEVKSRDPKYQVEVIIKNEIPEEHILQVQMCLFVTGRAWWDYVSYCAGLPMCVIRAHPLPEYQEAIKNVLIESETTIQNIIAAYQQRVNSNITLIPTEYREPVQEMYVS